MANDIEPFSVLSPFPHHVCLVLPNISTVFLFQKSLDKTGINLYNRFTMLKCAIQQGGEDYGDHFYSKGRLYLAYSTVHSMLIVFNNIMASAFEDELIPTNPAASKRIKITSRGKTERTALTPEQVTDIIHQIDTKLKGDDERRMQISTHGFNDIAEITHISIPVYSDCQVCH